MATSSVYLTLDHARVDGRTRNVLYRQKQLFALHDAIKTQAQVLIKTLQDTSRISPERAALEVYLTIDGVKRNFEGLNFKNSIVEEKKIRKGSSGSDRRPYGLVKLVVEDCGNPFFDTISALSAIIAAGNCCLIELQGVESSVTDLIGKCLAQLDSDSYALSDGKSEESEVFDFVFHIGATGSSLSETTTTKSSACFQGPAVIIIDHSADLSTATQAVVSALDIASTKSVQHPSEIYVHGAVFDKVSQALETQLTQAGQKSDAVKLTSVSSIDNAIDTVNAATRESPTGVAFLFGGPAHAKYLAQHTNAASYYVNHIPTNLLVGSIPRGSVVDPDHRFKPALFSTDVSVVQASPATKTPVKPLKISALQRAISISLMKLPKQGAGKRLDFFLQGIILFFGSGLLMTLAGTGFSVHRLGKLAYKYRQVPVTWFKSLSN